MKSPKLRKKWLIIPSFQLHFMNRLTALFCVIFCIFIAHSLYYFNELRSLGIAANLPANHVYFKFIADVANHFFLSVLIALGLSGLVFYIFGIYYSNKIAGPIYKITQSLNKHLEDPSAKEEFNIREGDYFKELAQKVSEVINKK